VALLGLGLVVAPAGASPASSSSSRAVAYGVGSAVSDVAAKQFVFKAVGFGDGGKARGYAFESQISSVFGDFQLRGPVNCLKVMGHVAYVGIKIDQAYGTASSHIGEEFTIIAQDDDQTTNGHRFDNSGFVNASPCQTGQLPHEVLDKGEIVVHTGHSSGDDKPAFPA
jgi:hypothetical protein